MGQFEELINKINALSKGAKGGILAGILALIAGGYYYVFYSDMLDKRTNNESAIKQLRKEKAEYETRKTEFLAFRNEVNNLLEEQKELLRVLPKRDDIEQFIENVNAQVELSGLQKVASTREGEVPEDLYVRIPIKMSLVGSFHQINRFFKNVGELQRIVTIADLQLTAPSAQDLGSAPKQVTDAAPQLKAEFTAQTFRFLDKGQNRAGGKAGAKPGAAPAAKTGGAK